MTRLLLVRHGITDWNANERLQGQSDLPLNAAGRRQIQALAGRLAAEPIGVIFTSDLQRSRESAELIAAQHACPVVALPAWREVNFGYWEGLTWEEIQARDPQGLAAWKADWNGFTPPGGESLMQLAERVDLAFQRLRDRQTEGTLLLVSHGGPLQVLLCLALGLPAQQYWQFHLSPGSLSEVNLYPEGAILNRINETCHLVEE